MNPIHTMLANSMRGCILDNSFNDKQQVELFTILEKFQSVKISNIYKFTKYLKQFEDKYNEFGGDAKMLEMRIKNIRDAQYEAAAKIVPGITIEKKGD